MTSSDVAVSFLFVYCQLIDTYLTLVHMSDMCLTCVQVSVILIHWCQTGDNQSLHLLSSHREKVRFHIVTSLLRLLFIIVIQKLAFFILEMLRQCRDYRDKIIRDHMYSRMSPIPTHPNHYEDAGYRSDESHHSHSGYKAKQFPSAFTAKSK